MLRQSDGFILKPDLDSGFAVFTLVNNDLRIFFFRLAHPNSSWIFPLGLLFQDQDIGADLL